MTVTPTVIKRTMPPLEVASAEAFREQLRTALVDRSPHGRITNAQLARTLGVSPSVVSRWLHGEITPTFDNCVRLRRVLALEFDEIFDAEATEPPQ